MGETKEHRMGGEQTLAIVVREEETDSQAGCED